MIVIVSNFGTRPVIFERTMIIDTLNPRVVLRHGHTEQWRNGLRLDLYILWFAACRLTLQGPVHWAKVKNTYTQSLWVEG